MAEAVPIIVSAPARPWLPWIAFGVLVGALGPEAASLAVARFGVTASALALWWGLGLPLTLLAVVPLGPAWPWARRWLVFAACALLGGALAWVPARADAGVRLVEATGDIISVRRAGYTQMVALRPDAGQPLARRTTVIAPATPPLAIGDRVAVRGTWSTTDFGDEIRAQAVDRLALRDDGPRAWAWRALDALGERRELAAALLIGTGDPPERRAFRTAGLLHVLAVSGMHLAIAAGLGAWALRCLGVPWTPRLLAVAGMVIGYLWLTGASPATQRAAAMTVAIAIAALAAREPHGLGPLALAALALVTINPATAADRGFQLSLAAMVGILTLGRELIAWRTARWPMAAWPLDRPSWRAVLFTGRATCDGFAIGLAAWLATWPVVAWHFASATPWSPLTSLMVALPTTLALWLGLPTLLLGGLIPGGPWQGLYAALDASLVTLARGVELAARLPGATVPCSAPPVLAALLWPMLFLRVTWWPWWARGGLLALLAGWWWTSSSGSGL